MLIDWLTVTAEIVNFLVLVALLKHFLFGRLVEAMDSREKRIAARLEEAEQKDRDAAERLENLRVQSEQQQRERERIFAEARAEADREHKDMLEKARDSVRALELKWREDLDREKSAFLDEIRAGAANEVLAIARRAIKDLASADLQNSAVEAFLKNLDPAAKFEKDVVVRSAGELSGETRRRVEQTLGPHLVNGAHLSFEITPQMGWGIELRSNGRRMGWNPDSYIGSLEDNLREALEQRRE